MTTQNPGLVTIEGMPSGACGAITWWALSGHLLLEDLADGYTAEGLSPKHLPGLPTPANALHRAALQVQDKRTLVRPLDRSGMWEVLTESIVKNEYGTPSCLHSFECRVELRPDGTGLVTPEDHIYAAKILGSYRVYRQALIAHDISVWLTGEVHRLQGVPLRDRGGLYFLPADKMAEWQAIARVLRGCSSHLVYEVPALKTEQTVEAILSAVRKDAEDELKAMEEYMAREPDLISTKGLNSHARTASAVRAKLEHYAKLLGAALPDLTDRLETLTGAIGAARLIEQSTKNPEALGVAPAP